MASDLTAVDVREVLEFVKKWKAHAGNDSRVGIDSERLEQICRLALAVLEPGENSQLAAILAKFRSKQFACEQSGIHPEAAWWGEAQRLLGEVGDVEAVLEQVRKEAVREFAEALSTDLQSMRSSLRDCMPPGDPRYYEGKCDGYMRTIDLTNERAEKFQ